MLKFILKYKKTIAIALLLSAAPITIQLRAERQMAYSESEDKFLHEIVHSLSAYVKNVQEGKSQFFNFENKESYDTHIKRFKQSLEFIKSLFPRIDAEVKNYRAHSSPEFSATLRTIHHMVGHLKTAQEKWVEAVEQNRNVVTLGIALKQLQPIATKIKNEVTLKLVPALESHLSDHALIAEAEEIRSLVGILFADDIGFAKGAEYLMHRFKCK